ncbi:Cellulose synthase-like protein E6 [Dichanthelium oligosanthes]|uniref:Cellulose synthase-like protein E6 n=1 Tax=Dichanthelium oligosanthes TaxID=888268 RepID=A0A1E5W7G7_9POAL|nr:Cellulose synthase-like protein E6 [Dichanthelium oligosanthes]
MEGRLFATEKFGGRALYRLHAATVLAGICLVLYYRATDVPAAGSGRAAWLGMLAAELWFGLYWVLTQSVRWCPIRRRTFKDRLAARYGEQLPSVDIFVCTADPHSEPPSLVMATVLSLMAYNYPPEKLNVYLSDDGGSILTFYALWEASAFAKLWLPFCRTHNIEPRSPAAYFAQSDEPSDRHAFEEWLCVKVYMRVSQTLSDETVVTITTDLLFGQDMYEAMTERIDSAVRSGKVPEEIKLNHKGFSEWNTGGTSRDHQPTVQILIDGKDSDAVDYDGNVLPTLVYMAREKRPQYHHNFKAGAMNALIRVSSVISDSPIIMNVDCDMYSNNSDSIRDALCFFLDEEMGHKIAFVQYPQNYNNMTKNNIYGNSLNVINKVEMAGLDTWGGPMYIGSGCFHRREALCGRSFTKDYKEDWNRGIKTQQLIGQTEDKAKSLATCIYEHNTQWGNEIGLKYGCPVEDVITGLAMHCRGWESVYNNPPRAAFLGVGPTTMAQTILQHKRWSEGNFLIFLSKYCAFFFGHGKTRFPHQMGYSTYGLWAPNALPTLYYVVIPSLGLLKSTPLFPEIMSPWITPFIYVSVVKNIYSLYEALTSGDTLKGWWNGQRMWMVRRITSYLYGTIDNIRKLLGLSKMGFVISPKVSDEDESKRFGERLPCVDVFVCTADPQSEPPSLVIATVLSVMAYNYPAERLSVYLSDDGGSILTFYALWEASVFAEHWLPFCKRYNIEPRSPAAYFSESDKPHDQNSLKEWSFIKGLYEEITKRIDSAVMSGKIPEEIKANHKGFSEWNSEITSKNHQPIVQILIDGKGIDAHNKEGNVLPKLVYIAREKRPQYHHNFKAGAMNTLIRVSSVISNSPIILNVDCDMYSNNSDSIRDALCFFLDEEMGHKIGFVQYPQNYNNVTKNDIYDNSLRAINQVSNSKCNFNTELSDLDSVGGPHYIGSGCFHRREILCGRRFTKEYKEDWDRGIKRKTQLYIDQTEEKAKSLATCTYEHKTQWGNEIGLKYDCPVEDIITGLAIQCRGWESVFMSPPRAAFIGVGPTTLAQTILQHKRWSEGNFSIFLSKYCPFFFGHGNISLLHQMGYSIAGLWAPNSLPTLYYVIVPSLGLLKGIPLFPEIMSQWIAPFMYVSIVKSMYSLYEALLCGETLKGWWNGQRMWIVKRMTSYLFGVIDTIRILLGLSKMGFSVTSKVSDKDESKRYEQEMMEFGSFSPEYVIIATIALLNLVCLVGGLSRIMAGGGDMLLNGFFLQILLCGVLVIINIPTYEAMFLRKDRGRIPFSVTIASVGFVILALLVPII